LTNPSSLQVAPGTTPIRVDSYLTAQGIVPSRAQAQRLLDEGLITVNGQTVRPSHKLKGGERIDANIPAPEPLEILPENLPLEILFEDEHLAIVNKPAGMVTHPAPGNWESTLVHALLYHLKDLSGIGGKERPGIVHRLDKDTSGLMVVAKSDIAHGKLSTLFKERNLDRRYKALVAGHLKPDHGTIDLAIGRDRRDRKKVSAFTDIPRNAITHYRTLESLPNAALVECKLQTGRTHQIRVHLTHLNCPVLGDPVYGSKRAHPKGISIPRLMLHAARLHLIHPISGEALKFDVEPPADFQAMLEQLRDQD
jgi:23S rRNA pseudouridine1911/1915/1917 synthase